MQVQVGIEFEQLLRLVKNFLTKQLTILKSAIEADITNDSSRQEFKKLLLQGPTFSKKQLRIIAETRNAINKWRTK